MADFTQADLVAINEAIASGATEVKFADRTVKYRTLAEMLQTRKLIMRDLNGVARPNRVVASHGKGLAK